MNLLMYHISDALRSIIGYFRYLYIFIHLTVLTYPSPALICTDGEDDRFLALVPEVDNPS